MQGTRKRGGERKREKARKRGVNEDREQETRKREAQSRETHEKARPARREMGAARYMSLQTFWAKATGSDTGRPSVRSAWS